MRLTYIMGNIYVSCISEGNKEGCSSPRKDYYELLPPCCGRFSSLHKVWKRMHVFLVHAKYIKCAMDVGRPLCYLCVSTGFPFFPVRDRRICTSTSDQPIAFVVPLIVPYQEEKPYSPTGNEPCTTPPLFLRHCKLCFLRKSKIAQWY